VVIGIVDFAARGVKADGRFVPPLLAHRMPGVPRSSVATTLRMSASPTML